jgi:hypothetical protein
MTTQVSAKHAILSWFGRSASDGKESFEISELSSCTPPRFVLRFLLVYGALFAVGLIVPLVSAAIAQAYKPNFRLANDDVPALRTRLKPCVAIHVALVKTEALLEASSIRVELNNKEALSDPYSIELLNFVRKNVARLSASYPSLVTYGSPPPSELPSPHPCARPNLRLHRSDSSLRICNLANLAVRKEHRGHQDQLRWG